MLTNMESQLREQNALDRFDAVLEVSAVTGAPVGAEITDPAYWVRHARDAVRFADAVTADDDAPFRRVSGIGPKTAKLIVVQLAGKLAPSKPAVGASSGDSGLDVPAQVVEALVGLGWPERLAAETTAAVAARTETEATTVAGLLRAALAEAS